MRKSRKKTIILIAVILVVLAAAAGIIAGFLRSGKETTLVSQQNYVASKLLEMGDYEQGRSLAAQSDQMKPNMTSKELMVLAAAFQWDLDAADRYLDAYGQKNSDAVLDEIRNIIDTFRSAEAELSREDEYAYQEAVETLKTKMRQSLLTQLLQVQESISVKKGSAALQSMLDIMSSQGTGPDVQTADGSLLSRKAEAVYAIQTGDYNEAFDKAEKLYQENSSFENRARLANIMAKQGAYLDRQNSQIEALREKQAQLQEKLYELQMKQEQTESESQQRKLERQIEDTRADIQNTEEEIRVTPVKQAINFIETTTPVTERGTVAYKIELAQLYYQARDKDKAEELVIDLLKDGQGGDDSLTLLLEDFTESYLIMNGMAEKQPYQDENSISTVTTWNRISDAMGFIGDNYYSDYYYYEEGDSSFYSFLLGIMDQLYNGLIIRQIDAGGFPIVRVTVNVAMELEEELKKDNFTLKEMGEPLDDFRILNPDELEDSGEMSVVLVVDHSGSMSGTAMEDTKKAVASFVKSVDDNIRLGLVVFDDTAEVITSLGSGRNELLRGIGSVQADGGTSIYSGLELAGDELADEGGRKVIILLSDGEDGNPDRIDEVLDTLKRRNIYVYTIGFGGADTEYLSYIASHCGGKCIQADSSDVLGEIYAAIGQYMSNDYVIEFTAATDLENFTRTIWISVDVNEAFTEKIYHVGVPLEDILAEEGQTPLANYYREIGGSWTETE